MSVTRTLGASLTKYAAAFGLLVVTVMTVGCQRSASGPIGIVVSGDTAGWITPCGCASNQSGGLARRAMLVDQQRQEKSVVLLDAGGSASGTTEYHRVKLKSILQGMNLMGLQAHNLGTPETQLKPETLQQLQEDVGVTWLSSNLNLHESEWSPSPLVTLTIDGVQVAVAGVIDPEFVDERVWSAHDPVGAVVQAFDSTQADIRIVLAYMEQAEIQALAAALPEVHAVIGGPTGQPLSPSTIGNVTVLSSTNKGKFLASLTLDKPGDASSYRVADAAIVEVSSNFHENADQIDNVNQYYDALAKLDISADASGLVSTLASHRESYAIAGSASCTVCHASDDQTWIHSRHHHAWDVLVAKSAQFDPSCQQCHTTGYGLEGGFRNVASSIERVHVGCESCHGPSSEHVRDPKTHKTPWVARRQCLRCHDRENSPQFEYDAYWRKIIHGVEDQGKPDDQRTDVEVSL